MVTPLSFTVICRPLDGDLFRVPLADGFLVAALRRKHVVDRPVVLRRLELRVLRAAVVEDLNLHADVGGVALERRADADAVVGVLGQLEVELEDEVPVLLLGEEVAAVFLGGEQHTVFDLVALAGLVLGAVGALAVDPAGQILAVEERRELLLCALDCPRCPPEPTRSRRRCP